MSERTAKYGSRLTAPMYGFWINAPQGRVPVYIAAESQQRADEEVPMRYGSGVAFERMDTVAERGILVGDMVTVLRGKLKGQICRVRDHWTGADGKGRVELDVTSGRKILCVSSVKLVEPETDDHDCHAHLANIRMSDCRYGCRVWRCQRCGDEMLIHMAVYGCEDKAIDLPRKPQLEKWLCPGDMFTSWTGATGILALSSPDEDGFFEAIIPGVDDSGSRWHSDAVEPGTVRRPVADACPDTCPRCGVDLAALGRPYEHQHIDAWGDEIGTCAFTWRWQAPAESTTVYATWLDIMREPSVRGGIDQAFDSMDVERVHYPAPIRDKAEQLYRAAIGEALIDSPITLSGENFIGLAGLTFDCVAGAVLVELIRSVDFWKIIEAVMDEVASGHSCDAYLIDVRTSDCRYGCKIWRCQRCGSERLIHMAVYGCENQVVDL